MSAPWEEFVDDLIAEGKKLAKVEIAELVKSSKSDGSEFVRRQGRKLERYLNQVATGELSRREFEVLVKDLQSLTEIESLRLEVAAKASAQRLVNGIKSIILTKLLKVIQV